jgi:glucosamine-6-phosphate deaminase
MKYPLNYLNKFDLKFFFSLGSSRDHPESYHSFMWHHLFKHIDIEPRNVNILDGNAENLSEECARFEKKIKDIGGVELFIGG